MNDLPQLLNELSEVIGGSPAFMGLRLVNEERFYRCFQVLSATLDTLSPKESASRAVSSRSNSGGAVIQLLDELEGLVGNAKGGFMGKRLINEEEFFTKVQQLRSKLSEVGFSQSGSTHPLETHRSSRDLIAWARTLSREEQEEIVAALSQG